MHNKMLVLSMIFVVSLFALNSCSSGSDSAEKETVVYGTSVIADSSALPLCDSTDLTKVGQLYYLLSDSTFLFCSASGYSVI
ncbi:MAG: hypothetical protein WCR04_05810 [Fibrobacteraceae bacterium]